MLGFGTWIIILEIMVLDHKIFFFIFSLIFFCVKKKMLHLLNLLSPISHSPQTHISTNKQLCPQLNLNHLPLGCQPCLLPLSHTLPSEKTTILTIQVSKILFFRIGISVIKAILFFCIQAHGSKIELKIESKVK